MNLLNFLKASVFLLLVGSSQLFGRNNMAFATPFRTWIDIIYPNVSLSGL